MLNKLINLSRENNASNSITGYEKKVSPFMKLVKCIYFAFIYKIIKFWLKTAEKKCIIETMYLFLLKNELPGFS